MKRFNANTKKSRKFFGKTAAKTHVRNMQTNPMRGGHRI